MTEVVNLSKTPGERGADLRFLGGALNGEFCFVPYNETRMEGMSTNVRAEQVGGRTRVGPFSMFGPPPTVDITSYRRMRIRLATPSAVLDEMVMVASTLTDEQAKQALAKLTGLRLPVLHLFNVKRSSMISGVAWDKNTGTMDVFVVQGPTYRYFNMTDIEVMEFLAADSMGTHYNDVIRKKPSVNLGSTHAVIG